MKKCFFLASFLLLLFLAGCNKEETYEVSFETNGGTLIETITSIDDLVLGMPETTKAGYTFDGWYFDQGFNQPFELDEIEETIFTLYAKWTLITTSYDVEVYLEDLDGNYILDDTKSFVDVPDKLITITPEEILGFSFDEDHENTLTSTNILSDGTTTFMLYYTRNTYTITFVSNASLSISSITAKYGETISKPTNPVRMGYTFVDWFSDEALLTPYVFTTMPSSNITLYADWIGEMTTLYFNTNGGSDVDDITQAYGSSFNKPIDPTKEGYDFVGWYLESNFQTPFTSWIMPYGGQTLYAKWTEKTYTVSFETNGGSIIDPLGIKYTHTITEPIPPTKTDFVFGGWYSDENLLSPFSFGPMPMSNITLYAKWLDETDTSTISYQSSLDRYSIVDISGVVHAVLEAPYQGYILTDDTGSIMIYDDEAVTVGDKITLKGSLYHQNNIPTVMHVTEFTIDSINHDLNPIQSKTIHELSTMNLNPSHFGKMFDVSGILIKENDTYYLVSQSTYQKIAITSHFNQSILESLIHQNISATLMLMNYKDMWQVGMISYEATPYTDEDIIADTKNYLLSLYQQTYFSFETVIFPTSDPLNLASIDVSIDPLDAAFYDFETHQLAETTISRTVVFYANITVKDITSEQQINLTLEAIDFLTIEAFKALTDDTLASISATVIFTSDSTSLYGLFDGTETIYLYTHEYLEIGDLVWIIAKKSSYYQMPIIKHEDIRLLIINDKEQPISNQTTIMDDQTFLSLDLNDPSIYGQKVQLRGFIHEMMEGHFFQLELDQKIITLEPVHYQAFESLFDFVGLEIDIRGYITLLDDDTLGLYIEAIRKDLVIPDYDASERVDMILTLFSRTYANKTFNAFETFILYPYHPVLGGTITYDFIEGSAYYDMENQQFKYVLEPVDIKLELTITKDSVSKTYLYQTTLNSLDITSAYDLAFVGDYNYVYVQGIVIYRDPNVAYIMDDTGIIKVRIHDLNCYIGDEVVIYAQKETSYSNYEAPVLRAYIDEDPVIAILSRSNTFSIPMLEGFNALDLLDPEDQNTYHQYISLSGTLYCSYSTCYITNGMSLAYIEAADDYTLNKLIKLNGLSVTLKGLINGKYDAYEIFYGYQDDSLILNTYLDQDKLDYVATTLTNLSSIPLKGGIALSLPLLNEQVGATISYQMDSIYDAYFDLSTGMPAYVEEDREIIITATITISDTVYQNIDLTFTILSSVEPDQVLISSFLTLPEDTYKLQAKIVSVTRYEERFAFLIEDESGRIFVPLKQGEYYSNSTMVGRTITIIGTLSFNDGRPEVITTNYTISSYGTSVETDFIETDIHDIIQYNLYDLSVYGKPLLISGKLERLSYDVYAISNGKEMIRIHSVYQSLNNLERYQNLNVILKVFFIGDLDDDGIYDCIINNAFYGGTSTMMLAPYTDLDFANIILSDILDTIDMRTYKAYESIYLNNYHSYYPSASITYLLTSDPTAATLDSTILKFHPVVEDQEVTLTLTVTYQSATLTHELAFMLNHADIKYFQDLFEVLPELDDMGIRGQVIYYHFKYVYLLIEGDVYYIEGFFNDYFEYGDEVLLYGKKTTIDGETKYTYDIDIYDVEQVNPIFALPYVTPLDELDLDNMDPDLLRQVLTLYGILRYDEYLGWYYLSPTDPNQDIRIYLRAEIREDSGYYSLAVGKGDFRKSEMDLYLGLPVYMEVLNPGKQLMDTYVMVDLVPDVANIRLPEMTVAERMAYGKIYLDDIFESKPFDTGFYLNYDQPFYHQVLELMFEYELNDIADAIYVDPLRGLLVMSVSETTTVTLKVTLGYFDDPENTGYEDTHLVDVVINPIHLSSIYDASWGRMDEIYQIEGTIYYIYPDQYMLISDGTNTIYVDIYNLTVNFDIDLEVHDVVRVTAIRDHYEYGGYIPILDSVIDIVKLSNAPVAIPTPVDMTLDDILDLNHLVPSTFNMRISYTGTLIKVGTTYYTYFIRLEGVDHSTYDLELRANMDSAELDLILNTYINQQVTIHGYLAGFEYLYDPFDWFLFFESIT